MNLITKDARTRGADGGRAIDALRAWSMRRWLTSGAAAIGSILVIGIPTDLIDTPVFSREIPPTWWAWPALVLTSVLAGLLMATYVADPTQQRDAAPESGSDSGSRRGWAGGLLTFFAVGCPVCNKVVLLALGSTGALTWFEPIQPVLQVAAVVLLAWALRTRLRGQLACPVSLVGDVAREGSR